MVLLIALLLLAPVTAQVAPKLRGGLPGIPKYEVKVATSPIQVDGRLNDAAWKSASPLEFVFPWKDQTGPPQRTTVRLLWDEKNLYVGYDCEDQDITAQFTERDDPTYRDDAVEIFINPDPKQSQYYYGLEMNARGVLFDYFNAFGRFLIKRFDMDGVQLKTSLRGTLNSSGDKDEGWTLELAIPWSNFEELAKPLPPAAGSVWRVNLNRWDGAEPKRRLSQWSDSGMECPNPHYPDRFGELVFRK